jgi:hypothetical protein
MDCPLVSCFLYVIIITFNQQKTSRLEYKGYAYEVSVVKDVELPIHTLNVQDLNEMPSSLSLRIDLNFFRLPSLGESFLMRSQVPS